MAHEQKSPTFALCVRNDDCEDLELRKVYRVLSDSRAARSGYVRIIDESNEDFLYPESYFIPVRLPQRAKKALALAG